MKRRTKRAVKYSYNFAKRFFWVGFIIIIYLTFESKFNLEMKIALSVISLPICFLMSFVGAYASYQQWLWRMLPWNWWS